MSGQGDLQDEPDVNRLIDRLIDNAKVPGMVPNGGEVPLPRLPAAVKPETATRPVETPVEGQD